MNGIVYSESLKVGGDKFDEALQTYMKRKFGVVIGESTAELIKLQVGCATLNCKNSNRLGAGICEEFELIVFQKKMASGP